MKENLPLIIAIAVALVVSAGGCGGGEIETQSWWTDSTIVVDGKPEDWAGFPMDYFEEAKASLGLRNDAENLYILLRFRDEPLTGFLQRQVTLWIDKTGKKKKDFGIRYSGSAALAHSFPREGLTSEQKERFQHRESETQGTITVLEKEKSILIASSGKQGPAVATTCQQGFYCHEVRIPLQKSDSIPYAVGATLGEEISIGAELGASREDLEEMMQERGGMPGEGTPGGGMPGGGMPGGRRTGGGGPGGGGPGGGGQMPEKQEIWLKVTLASRPEEGSE